MNNFFQKILDAILSGAINFNIVKCVFVASPGFTKDQFGDFLANKTVNNKNYEVIQQNLKKFIYVHSSSGYKQALQEIMSKPEIMAKIKNLKASDDIIVMEKLNETLAKEMDKVIFGMKAINVAFQKDAIDTLIVSDDFLRKISGQMRKEITSMMRKLTENKREVIKMSSMHYTGEKINSFGGIVGILRFVPDELNEVDEEINSTDNLPEAYINDEKEEGEDNYVFEDGDLEEEEKDEVEEMENYSGLSVKERKGSTNSHEKYEFGGNKRKPSKDILKERDQTKKMAVRKKSSYDDDDF